jgi:DNA-binding transcriptional MerR regulator
MSDLNPNYKDEREKKSKKSSVAYRTISEVAIDLKLEQHVLRFWENKFPQITPLKRAGGRRYYRPEDIELLKVIKSYLHTDGYTIRGVQKLLQSNKKLKSHSSEKDDSVKFNNSRKSELNIRSEMEDLLSILEDIKKLIS